MDVALCTEKVSKVNVDLYSASSWSTTSNALTFSRKSALISDSQASANTAKSFKQTQCCCRNNEMFACQQLQHVFECCLSSLTHNTCSNAVCRHWHSPTIVLSLVCCPVDDTLFKVGPEVRCLGVSGRCCCYVYLQLIWYRLVRVDLKKLLLNPVAVLAETLWGPSTEWGLGGGYNK